MARLIHRLPLYGLAPALWVMACMPSLARAAQTPADGVQSSLALTPTAPASNAQAAEAVGGESPSALPPVADTLRLDVLPPVDAPADDWSDYPNHWWLTTPLTFWLPGINGHVGIKRSRFSKNAPVDLSFSDLTKSLQYAVGLNVETGYGPIFGGFQGNWVHWDKDGITGPLGISSIDVDADYALFNGYFGYHFLDLPLGNGNPYPTLGVDALLGTDWTYLKLKIKPARIESESKDVNWFDPYVGLRGKFALSQNIDIQSTGEAGGFDLDNDRFFWMANVLFEYRFTPTWSVFAGYQAMSQDFDNGSFVYKIITSGPVIGLAHRW